MPNRLASATSSYLRQHAENPVDWWPWCDEAWDTAQRLDRPVLVSIGYAACHWCHVMAHESFEDAEIAAYLAEHLVAIKVDREEHPDVDAAYMSATQAMTGRGGWPMTVFATPTGEPFYAGTYLPPRPAHGMASFRQVLEAVVAAWADRRGEVLGSAERISDRLAAARRPAAGGPPPDEAALEAAVHRLATEFDPDNAGFGGAPKFPPSMVLEFLLRHAARTGSVEAASMAAATLDRMARSGMYDQLEGGFARYAVDAAWVVPHFEKMLNDNALLLRVYLHWWRASGEPLAARVAGETAEFLLARLRTDEGGFAAALDADTALPGADTVHAGEGATYVWTPGQLAEVLGPADGAWAAGLLTVTETGTFERGASTLQLRADPDEPARWAGLRARLRDARMSRPQPGRDDTVVAEWNGLAIAALAEAGALLELPALIEAAASAARLLLCVHRDGTGRLLRTSYAGTAGSSPATLADHANLAEGLIALYAVTGEPVWLTSAGGLLDEVLARFLDPDGALLDTAPDAADPRLARLGAAADPTDSASPAGVSAAAGALLSYAALTGSARHRETAELALGPAGALARQAPRFAGWALAVAEARAAGPVEVAVIGPPEDPATRALHRVALLGTSPGAVVALGPPGSTEPALLRERGLVHGRPAAYVCTGFLCQAPVSEPADLASAVSAVSAVSARLPR